MLGLAKSGRLRHYRLGRRYRFSESEVLEDISAGRGEPDPQPEEPQGIDEPGSDEEGVGA